MLQFGSALKGYAIQASDGALGTVNDFLFDDRTWKVRWLVVDTGGWLPGRKLLIHPSAIGQADYETHELPVKLTMAQVEHSPDIMQDRPVTKQMENNLFDYYGWDPLWASNYYGAGITASALAPAPGFGEHSARVEAGLGWDRNDGDPNLRSINAVTGYHVHANDGNIGHIQNFLCDDASWEIRYIIVDTRNWWPGKHVLVSPHAVREISWSQHQILLNISRDKVKSSPPWDPVDTIDQGYEDRLHRHYNWPGEGW